MRSLGQTAFSKGLLVRFWLWRLVISTKAATVSWIWRQRRLEDEEFNRTACIAAGEKR